MSIVINNAGGGGGSGGIFKTVSLGTTQNPPSSSVFYEIWERGSASKQRPVAVTVMMWSLPGWMNKTDDTPESKWPPAAGAAFGTFTLKGGAIPEKLYYWRGRHQENATYVYTNKSIFSGCGASPDLSKANLLPNPGSQSLFLRQDMKAADAVNNNFANFSAWDAVYNGGDGHFWVSTNPPPNSDAEKVGSWKGQDTPGSNGSIFGPGKTCADGAKFPASCGGSGTATARGPLAHGVAEPSILRPLSAIRSYAVEVAPASTFEHQHAGNGKANFSLPQGMFGISNGAPFTPQGFEIPGGLYPVSRYETTQYKVKLVLLIQVA